MAAPEIAVPMFGCKNHVGIDREHGFVLANLAYNFTRLAWLQTRAAA